MEILPAHHYQFSGLLTAIASFSLVVLVHKKGVDSYLRHRFVLYYLALFVWSLSLFICTSVYSYKAAYFFCQLTHAGAIMIPVLFLHFTLAYLRRTNRFELVALRGLYLITAFFMFINLFFRDLLFEDVVRKLSFPYFPNDGVLYLPYTIMFALIVAIAHIILFKAMLESSGIRKKQIKFFLIANALGYTGGIGCFLPVYDLEYFPFPYGPYGVFLLSMVSGYAILKYRFIDLQFLLKRSIVFAALIAFVIGVTSFFAFLIQNVLSNYMNVNPFLISAASAATIIAFYDRLREFLITKTDRFLFQNTQDFKTVLNHLSQHVITILDLDKVGLAILHTFENALHLESGVILLKTEDGKAYKILDAFGLEKKLEPIDTGDPLVSYFSDSDKVVNLDLDDNVPDFVKKAMSDFRARVMVPLFFQAQLIGILVLGRKKSDQEYTRQEMEYFPAISAQIAVALSNAREIELRKKNQADYYQQSKLAAIGIMASGIAHELKNPLQVIRGCAGLVDSGFKKGFYKTMPYEELSSDASEALKRVFENQPDAVRRGRVRNLLKR